MSDDKPIPVNLPEGLEAGLDEFRRENSNIFGVRKRVEDALRDMGANITGAGCGFGEADIDIELEGARYNVVIKPRERPLCSDGGAGR